MKTANETNNPRAPPKRGTRPDGAEPRELQLVLDPEFL
jgi:hypothetical protein